MNCAFQEASLLEPVLHERAELLFRCLLGYITEMLVWERYCELPEDLEPRYCQAILLWSGAGQGIVVLLHGVMLHIGRCAS